MNGKRKMEKKALEDSVETVVVSSDITARPTAAVSWPSTIASPSGTASERPRGLCGLSLKSRRGLNIPNPVQEDLPSPSTELSKLTFTAVSRTIPSAPPQSAPLDCDPPSSGQEEEKESVTEKMDVEVSPFSHCADNESECANLSQVQIGVVGHAAVNPFFANLPKSSNPTPEEKTEEDFEGSRVISQSKEYRKTEGTMSATIPFPVMTLSPDSPQKSRWRTASEPAERTSLSVENPLFPSRKPKKFRFGAYSKSSSSSKTDRKTTGGERSGSAESARVQQLTGISQRISQFLRRAQPVPLMSATAAIGIIADSASFSFFTPPSTSTSHVSPSPALEGVVRSATSGGISSNSGIPPVPAPPKSKSESGCLYSMCDDLESPESGFVESPLADSISGHPYGRDPERESIGSSSSLEIAVN